jgi:hypothetical protein
VSVSSVLSSDETHEMTDSSHCFLRAISSKWVKSRIFRHLSSLERENAMSVFLIILFHIAVIECVVGTHLTTVSIETVVLKVIINMASVMLTGEKAFLGC